MAYLLFAGNDYYPEGGAEDLQGKFDTIDAALAAHALSDFVDYRAFANVLCLDTLKVVKNFHCGTWRER